MSLLSSLITSASALDAFDQALSVTQNNVVNASTPGYAKQTQNLDSEKFSTTLGYGGGVRAGDVQSARNEYDEQAVRQQNTLLGESGQNVSSLTSIESYFDISGSSGIATSLNTLYQAFSAWGQTPTDGNAKQTVLNAASTVASAFNDAATGLQQVTSATNVQLEQSVAQVNTLVGQMANYNSQIMAGDRNDAGLDAQVHSTLEELSQYVNFTASEQSDGSYTLLLNGQVPLLIENQQYALSTGLEQPTDAAATIGNAPPLAYVKAYDGADVTSQVTSGQLGGLLNIRNTVLPTYIGDAYQAGSLNTLAQGFADRVNQILTNGSSTDPTVTSGGAGLFTYDTTNPANVAQSLTVNSAATTSTLVATDPATGVVNGIPIALSNLSTPTNTADMINGQSYTEYYGSMATGVGNALSTATGKQTVQQSALAQAKSLRQQDSGVSLDAEAMTLVQFQTAYEANSRLISVLDQLTSDVVNILGTATA